MNKSSLVKSMLLVGAGAILAAGCVTRERVVYRQAPPPASEEVVVSEPPPPPIAETVVVAPDPSYVWIGGVWAWHGRWVWEAGHWTRPPHPGAVWVAHRYVRHGGVNVYVHGYWR